VSWYRKISRLAYVGSENFTNASLNRNRELGVITSNSAIVSTIKSVLTVDAERAAIWTP
jgi:phosphatidylserine/phosphatidylglycerophosphate/cardiolipin synthase-like enzyme